MNQFSRRAFHYLTASSIMGVSSPNFIKAESEKHDSKVTQLYKSLSDEQISKVVLSNKDRKKSYISNWWYVHKEHRINNTFTPGQRELIATIFDDFHDEAFRKKARLQVEKDKMGKESNAPSVGFLGKPGDSDFEFLYTGHHVTRRCNGNSDRGQGFDGPIFYGNFAEKFHETKDHPGNPYWYQSLLLHEWVKKLDLKDQNSLVDTSHPRSEKSIFVLQPSDQPNRGLSIGMLSEDLQFELLKTIHKMLSFLRKDDVEITIERVKSKLSTIVLSCYTGKFDIGSDKIYDTWQMEAPGFIWYHRGEPHIHAYFDLKSS